MKLYATPLSHFSRKVRILLDLYEADYEFVNVGNVANADHTTFNSNPLMKVPVLADGDQWLIDSDHIARYVVKKFGPRDEFNVLTEDLFDLNARAIMNGIMNEEVKLILARRTGVPTENYPFFDKSMLAIQNGFQWLEDHAGRFSGELDYLKIHLVCLWEHVEHYELVPLPYGKLKATVENFSRLPEIRKSSPTIKGT